MRKVSTVVLGVFLLGSAPALAGGFEIGQKQSSGWNTGSGGYTTSNNFQPHGGGGGANTAYGPYNTAACCTFAPGGFPKGDAVETVSLFQYSRGAAETIPVVQEPPRYHWYYPPVRIYRLEDVLKAIH